MSDSGYDPRAIANAILAQADRRGRTLTHLSVQKLLYFAHAAFLVRYRRPLVRGVFEAWEHGPVCRPVYDALKGYGREPISAMISQQNPFTKAIAPVEIPGDVLVEDHIADLMRSHGHLTASQLRDLSHRPRGAWAIVWERSKTGVTLGNRIDDKLTAERFGQLKMSLSAGSTAEDPDEAAPVAGD
jgi:uncharacterized phage-associated protein